MRRVAFLGVALSTVAVTAVLVSVPLLYHHLQSVQSSLDSELTFCRVRTESMCPEGPSGWAVLGEELWDIRLVNNFCRVSKLDTEDSLLVWSERVGSG